MIPVYFPTIEAALPEGLILSSNRMYAVKNAKPGDWQRVIDRLVAQGHQDFHVREVFEHNDTEAFRELKTPRRCVYFVKPEGTLAKAFATTRMAHAYMAGFPARLVDGPSPDFGKWRRAIERLNNIGVPRTYKVERIKYGDPRVLWDDPAIDELEDATSSPWLLIECH